MEAGGQLQGIHTSYIATYLPLIGLAWCPTGTRTPTDRYICQDYLYKYVPGALLEHYLYAPGQCLCEGWRVGMYIYI